MKSILLLFISAMLFLSVLSCVDETSSLGSKWIESSFRNVQTDSCTVSLSTILSDSLATSGDTVCQIGHRDDALWGKISASFYAEYELPSFSFDEDINYLFDSLTIRLYASGNYLGDTLAAQHISLHRLTENMELDNDGYLYNATRTSYEATPLTTFSFQPMPQWTGREIEVRLPDDWGKEWFDLLLADARQVQSQDYFHDYFKGIAFIPDENDVCVNGFQVNDSSFCITLYYHEVTESPTEKTLVFNTSSTLTYNRVTSDRGNTPVADLTSGIDNALLSTQTEHQCYLQGLTGMYISIDFPYLNNLCMEGEMVSIESATLKLYPVRGTYDGMYPLPESLTLYTTNDESVIQDVITDLSGSSVQTGDLVVDDMSYEGTYYSFDLTSFLQDNLGQTGYNHKKLQLLLPDNLFYTTLEGVIFGDGSHTANKENTKLVVLYKVYQQ